MSTYRVKTGHDQPLVDLVVVSPQPQSTGIQVTRRTVAASGAVLEEGRYIELSWGVLGTAAAYNAILTLFGLNAALTANVTVYVRDQFWQWGRFNGLAVRPQMGQGVRWANSFPRGIVVLVRDLSEAS